LGIIDLIFNEFSSEPLSTTKTAIEILVNAIEGLVFITSCAFIKNFLIKIKNKLKRKESNMKIGFFDFYFLSITSLKPRKLKIKKHESIIGWVFISIITAGLIYLSHMFWVVNNISINSVLLSFKKPDITLLVSKNKIESTRVINPFNTEWSISKSDCKKYSINQLGESIGNQKVADMICENFKSANFDGDFEIKLKDDLKVRGKFKFVLFLIIFYGLFLILIAILKTIRSNILLNRVKQHYKVLLVIHKIKSGKIKLSHRTGVSLKPTEEEY